MWYFYVSGNRKKQNQEREIFYMIHGFYNITISARLWYADKTAATS